MFFGGSDPSWKLEFSTLFFDGFPKIMMPYSDFTGEFQYDVGTATTTGTISTQYFGNKFNWENVLPNFLYEIHVHPPASVMENTNVTLHFLLEKISMKDLSVGEDTLVWGTRTSGRVIPHSVTNSSKNFTPPGDINPNKWEQNCEILNHYRSDVITTDIRNQKLKLMPGFKLTWHYSGVVVKPEARYYNDLYTRAFTRNDSR